MSDPGSPADDKRERSEERPIADHQNVSAKEPLLLHPRLLPHKRKSAYNKRRDWVNLQGNLVG